MVDRLYENILCERSGRVTHLTLNQPQLRNPLSKGLCHDLIDALEAADRDPEVSAILLTGAGDSFCAGGNLREFQTYRSLPSLQVYQDGEHTATLFQVLGRLTTPLIGAVNGAAFGGGFGLVCACHMVVAAETARMGCTEVRLGLFPLVILPALRLALGDRRARELSLTARILSAQEAAALGVVTRVVPPAELMTAAMALAEQVASASPIGNKLGLTGFNRTSEMSYDDAIDYLNTLRVLFFQSEDVHEGATAFLERRKPQWRGR